MVGILVPAYPSAQPSTQRQHPNNTPIDDTLITTAITAFIMQLAPALPPMANVTNHLSHCQIGSLNGPVNHYVANDATTGTEGAVHAQSNVAGEQHNGAVAAFNAEDETTGTEGAVRAPSDVAGEPHNGDETTFNTEDNDADDADEVVKKPKKKKGANVTRPRPKKANVVPHPDYVDGKLLLPDNIVPKELIHIDDDHAREWLRYFPLMRRTNDGSADDSQNIEKFKEFLRALHDDIVAVGNKSFGEHTCDMLNDHVETELRDHHRSIAKINNIQGFEKFLHEVHKCTSEDDPIFCMRMNIRCIHQINQEAGSFVRSYLVERLNEHFAHHVKYRPFHITNDSVANDKKSRNHSIIAVANFGASEAKRKLRPVEDRVLNMEFRASLRAKDSKLMQSRFIIPCDSLSQGSTKAYISIQKRHFPYEYLDRENTPTLEELKSVLKNGSGRDGIITSSAWKEENQVQMFSTSKEGKLFQAVQAYTSAGVSDVAIVDTLIQVISLQRRQIPHVIDSLKQSSNVRLIMSSNLQAQIKSEVDRRVWCMMRPPVNGNDKGSMHDNATYNQNDNASISSDVLFEAAKSLAGDEDEDYDNDTDNESEIRQDDQAESGKASSFGVVLSHMCALSYPLYHYSH